MECAIKEFLRFLRKEKIFGSLQTLPADSEAQTESYSIETVGLSPRVRAVGVLTASCNWQD